MRLTVNDLITIPWALDVLFTVVRLKLFSHLSNKNMTVEEVSMVCGAVPKVLQSLMKVCVELGLLERNKQIYSNSYFSEVYLVEGRPHYLGDFLHQLYWESKHWADLYDLTIGNEAALQPKIFKQGEQRTFIKAMNNLGMQGEAEALRHQVDLTDCTQMVDVGGGSGLYSITLCRKYAQLHSTILDLKDTLEISKEFVALTEVKDRIHFREADMAKDSFGKDLDAVLLSDVIYNEQFAEDVLQNAHDCVRPGGQLIIRGYYTDPVRGSSLFSNLFVLNILIGNPAAKVLDIGTLQKLVSQNGFGQLTVSPLTERSLLLKAIKPE